MNKGLIIDKKEKYIIVMDDKAHYKRLNNKVHADIGQKIYFTDSDIYENVLFRNPFMRHLVRISLTMSLLLVLLISNGFFTIDFAPTQPFDSRVATVVTIDINPSVKLSLNSEGVVVEARAINQDAKSLDLNRVIGFEVEAAIEWIVTEAHIKGYINTEDEIEDYVLVTAVDILETDDEAVDENDDKKDEVDKGGNSDQLMARIEEKIASSSELQSVNVALIKATKVEMREAEGKKVPVGLYVVHGEVVIDEESMTVKEYFAEQENIEAFKNKGDIVSRSKGKDKKSADDEAATESTTLTTEPSTESITDADDENIENNNGNNNNGNNNNNNGNGNGNNNGNSNSGNGNNGNKGNSGNGN